MIIDAFQEEKLTVQEYFELERHSELSHEFDNGKRILKASKSKKANTITLNIVEIIRDTFYKKGYDVYANTIKVETNNGNTYRCPDVVVAPASDDSDDYFVLFPEIIVEIASKDSMHTDGTTKLKEYKKNQHHAILHHCITR